MNNIDVTTQAELDRVIATGDRAICRSGRFVAWEQAHVVAGEQAHVEAWGSAHVVAWGSAHVVAGEQAHVVAGGQAHVVAGEQAHVEAWGQAHVEASKFVSIHRQSKSAKVTGGVQIEVPEIETIKDFCDWYGVAVSRGYGIFYKVVGEDFRSDHGATYEPDTTVTCEDWDAAPRCGNGLHFSPHPVMARDYGDGERFVACKVKLADAVVIRDGRPDKIKAPRCKVHHECDEWCQPISHT